jgi:type 2 lantibiotic biosynthesis protein LanM
MGEDDLGKQVWFIRSALGTLATVDGTGRPGPAPEPGEGATATRQQLLAAATQVGDRLAALALRGDDGASWLGLTTNERAQSSVAMLDIDLYSGLPGIALFLAQLAARTGATRHRRLAEETLRTLRRAIGLQQAELTRVGGFLGWGGIIYTLSQLAVLWDRPSLLDEAESLVSRIEASIDGDRFLDLSTGAAGAVMSLLALDHCRRSERTLAVARRCGERLLGTAVAVGEGRAWLLPNEAAPLAGLSHGAAGGAMALARLGSATGDARFTQGALAALRYERGLFDRQHGNWPDLRLGPEGREGKAPRPRGFMTAWCHGASGIGLGRLACVGHLADPTLHVEIDVALSTTLATGFGLNDSLCHGDLGNLDLLLEAQRCYGAGDPRTARLGSITAAVLEGAAQRGWRYGVTLDAETPGLMTGLAGIGYQLLRLADPGRVPSILLLDN